MIISNREVREQLQKIEQELTVKFAHISASFGITGLKQLLLASLFVSVGDTRSLTELVSLTGYSKASVSRHMRELEIEVPFVQRVKKPQDKEKYYQLNADLMDVIKGFIGKSITDEAEPTLEASEITIRKLQELKSKTEDQDALEEIDSILQRMFFLKKSYDKYLWMAEKFLIYWEQMEKEWEETHGKRD